MLFTRVQYHYHLTHTTHLTLLSKYNLSYIFFYFYGTMCVYCYCIPVTCTQLLKFFAGGKPCILPRPYFTSEPTHKGYEIICPSWMQHLIKNRNLLSSYLNNLTKDKKLKKVTLLNLNLSENRSRIFLSWRYFFHPLIYF